MANDKCGLEILRLFTPGRVDPQIGVCDLPRGHAGDHSAPIGEGYFKVAPMAAAPARADEPRYSVPDSSTWGDVAAPASPEPEAETRTETCPTCHGSGGIPVGTSEEIMAGRLDRCHKCDGFGRIAPSSPERERALEEAEELLRRCRDEKLPSRLNADVEMFLDRLAESRR